MIQRLKDWFHHDDQEIFRLEWRRSVRWLLRPPGLYVLLLLFAVNLLVAALSPFLLTPMIEAGTLLSEWWIYYLVLAWARPLLFLGIWIYMIQRFTIRPFQNERLMDLRLTLISGREMWPAFLAAPFLLIGLQSVFSLAASYSSQVLVVILKFVLYVIPNDGQTGEMTFYSGLVPLISAVSSIIVKAAVTAFAVQGALPKGGSTIRLLFWLILGYVMVYGLPIAVQTIATLYPTSSTSQNPFGDSWITIIYVLLAPLAAILIALLLFGFSLRRLRSEKFWQRILANRELQS